MSTASWIPLILLFFCSLSEATFKFPQNLNSSERIQSLEVLGLGTAPKGIFTAYSLGGHSGLEVSTIIESINVSRVSKLGNTASNSGHLVSPNIIVGKGIYNDSEIYFEFVPFTESSKISKYGMQFRFQLYRYPYFPFTVSLFTYGNSANLSNQLTTRTLGGDLLAAVAIGDFSLQMGFGRIASKGDFLGGLKGITDTGANEIESIVSPHWKLSLVYHRDILLTGISFDQYRDSVLSFKVGIFL